MNYILSLEFLNNTERSNSLQYTIRFDNKQHYESLFLEPIRNIHVDIFCSRTFGKIYSFLHHEVDYVRNIIDTDLKKKLKVLNVACFFLEEYDTCISPEASG